MILGGECSRDDVAGIRLADALPQKCRARPPGADIGSVCVFLRSELPVCHSQAHIPRVHNLRGIFADADAVARRKVR